ncbi:MFS transporter [Streptacidiphilus melanogenes]|uniref:MFS transporter n=1 Tax=Streptacidiphilus melanogenes TaxID=411235 RepID=UPI0009FED031|nr:MFS transporter [Streptacidiphilus melanogenes]
MTAPTGVTDPAPDVAATSLLGRLLPSDRSARVLAAATLVNMVGNGFYLASSMLFFTRVVQLSTTEVGEGLAVCAVVGVFAGVPLGHLADRLGAREVFIALQLVQAAAMMLFPLVHGFPAFLAVVVVAAVGQRGGTAVGGALIAYIATPARRTSTRAYLRSVINAGTAVGVAAAGFALQANSRHDYVLLVLGNGLTFLLAAVILLWLPRVPPRQAPPQASRAEALRDRPYLAVAALSGVLAFQYDVMSVALPLWVVQETGAPRWSLSLLLVGNTAVIVLFQVRAARGVVDVTSAGRVTRRSAVVFLVSCTAIALAAGTPAAVALPLLAGGVLVHSVGELWFAAGTFELGYGLARDHAQGQYQGVFNLAAGLARSASPLVLTTLCLEWGRPGWIVLGIGLAVTGLAVPPVAAWAARSRLPEPPLTSNS